MPPIFEYTVDGEPLTTSEHELTATEILETAGRDPAMYYLVEVQGAHQVSYEGKPDAVIHMHQHAKFVSVILAPTPVS